MYSGAALACTSEKEIACIFINAVLTHAHFYFCLMRCTTFTSRLEGVEGGLLITVFLHRTT